MNRLSLPALILIPVVMLGTEVSCSKKAIWCQITVKNIQIAPDGKVICNYISNMGADSQLMTQFVDNSLTSTMGILGGPGLEKGDSGVGAVQFYLPSDQVKRGGAPWIHLKAGESYRLEKDRSTLSIYEYVPKEGSPRSAYFELQHQ